MKLSTVMGFALGSAVTLTLACLIKNGEIPEKGKDFLKEQINKALD